MSKESLEHIIRQKFEGASSSVPAGAWSGIESQIGGAAAGAAGAGGTISLFTKLIIGAAVSAAIIGSVVLLRDSDTQTNQETVQEVTPQPKSLTETTSNEITQEPVTVAETSAPVQTAKPSAAKQEVKDQTIQTEKETVDEFATQDDSSLEIAQTTEADETLAHQNNTETKESSVTSTQPDKDETPQVVIPSKITSSELSQDPLIYEFSLNRIDEHTSVQWFVNDEFKHTGESYKHEQTFDAELTVMALVSSEFYETKSLFKNIQVELPIVLSVPDVFTPNGDILNPEFSIHPDESKNVDSYTISIFNSQSKLVFESTEHTPNWNGDLPNGNPAPAGTYVYIITAYSSLGNTITQKDTFTLLR